MRSWTVLPAGTLVLGSAFGASVQDAAEARRSGWYVGGGVGGAWPSSLAQNGWNRDLAAALSVGGTPPSGHLRIEWQRRS